METNGIYFKRLLMGNLSLSKDEVVDFVKRAAYNFASELLATGTLVFAGCMSTVTGLGQHEDLTGIALSFALAVATAVEVGIHMSGGHVNPILTVTAMIFNRISVPMGIIYVLGQLAGSLLAYGLIAALTPHDLTNVSKNLGACTTVPNPNISLVQAFFVEFWTSTILVLVVCAQWDPRNEQFGAVSIKIGLAVFTLAYAAAPYTGCSMNPARSLGPAVWNNTWKHHWVYWAGPLSASIIWSLIYFKLFVELDPRKGKEVGA